MNKQEDNYKQLRLAVELAKYSGQYEIILEGKPFFKAGWPMDSTGPRILEGALAMDALIKFIHNLVLLNPTSTREELLPLCKTYNDRYVEVSLPLDDVRSIIDFKIIISHLAKPYNVKSKVCWVNPSVQNKSAVAYKAKKAATKLKEERDAQIINTWLSEQLPYMTTSVNYRIISEETNITYSTVYKFKSFLKPLIEAHNKQLKEPAKSKTIVTPVANNPEYDFVPGSDRVKKIA